MRKPCVTRTCTYYTVACAHPTYVMTSPTPSTVKDHQPSPTADRAGAWLRSCRPIRKVHRCLPCAEKVTKSLNAPRRLASTRKTCGCTATLTPSPHSPPAVPAVTSPSATLQPTNSRSRHPTSSRHTWARFATPLRVSPPGCKRRLPCFQ